MITFKLCESFIFSGIFSCKKRKRDTIHAEDLMHDLIYMQDTYGTKEAIINRSMQQLRRALHCDYYVLHQIDVRHVKDSKKEVDQFNKHVKNKDNDIKGLVERKSPRPHKQNVESVKVHVNMVSQTFVRDCGREFSERYLMGENKQNCAVDLTSLDNIFGHVLRTGKYFFTNNIQSEEVASCRFPPGHPIIKSFIAIPFKNENGVVYAIAGFANSSKKLTAKNYTKIKPAINMLSQLLPDLLFS